MKVVFPLPAMPTQTMATGGLEALAEEPSAAWAADMAEGVIVSYTVSSQGREGGLCSCRVLFWSTLLFETVLWWDGEGRQSEGVEREPVRSGASMQHCKPTPRPVPPVVPDSRNSLAGRKQARYR